MRSQEKHGYIWWVSTKYKENGLAKRTLISYTHEGNSRPALPKQITLYVLCGSTRLTLSSATSSTVSDLKSLLRRLDRRHPIDPILSFSGISVLQDHRTLLESSIGHETTISMTMHIQVYVVNNTGLKITVTISLHARVSSLKLAVSAKLKTPVPDFWFACSGEILEDHQLLGHYPQIVPGSEIVVGLTVGFCELYRSSQCFILTRVSLAVSKTRVSNLHKFHTQVLAEWNPNLTPQYSNDLPEMYVFQTSFQWFYQTLILLEALHHCQPTLGRNIARTTHLSYPRCCRLWHTGFLSESRRGGPMLSIR